MRVLIVSAVGFALAVSAARADRMIDEQSILAVAPELLRSECYSDCLAGDLMYKAVDLPLDIQIGERQAFLLWDPAVCGSGGCSSALVAIGDQDVHYLADGLNLSIQDPRVTSASAATLIGATPSERIPSQPAEPAGGQARYEDTLYSSLTDANAYEAYRRIFTGNRIDEIVNSVDGAPSAVLAALILQSLGDEPLGARAAQMPLIAQDLAPARGNAVLYEAMMLELAQMNGLTLAELQVMNDARNINQRDYVLGGKDRVELEDVESAQGWTIASSQELAFHTIGGYSTDDIRKYVHEDGSEYVFRREGTNWVFLDDGVNTGAFNYINSAESKAGHFILDMVPWVLWGTGGEDKLTLEERADRFDGSVLPFIESSLRSWAQKAVSPAIDAAESATALAQTVEARIEEAVARTLGDVSQAESVAVTTPALPRQLGASGLATDGFLGPSDVESDLSGKISADPDWLMLAEGPSRRLEPGEVWGAVGFAADGSASFDGRSVFPAAKWAPDNMRLVIYEAPDGRSALLVHQNLDWGGIRAVLVQVSPPRILNPAIIGSGQVREEADPVNVRQVNGAVAWSGDGTLLAFPLETGEFSADLAVLDRQTGSMATYRPEVGQLGAMELSRHGDAESLS